MCLTILALGLAAVIWLRWQEDRRRWSWRELSLSARLREAETRGLVFERALARLRRDADAGTLEVNEAYRPLFDRLTAEARGAGDES